MTGDQVAKWKAALAAQHRKQRKQRGRNQFSRERTVQYRPGMARIRPPADNGDVTITLARCTMRGCPVRWRDGEDRPCADHQPASISGGDWLARFSAMAGEGERWAGEGGEGEGDGQAIPAGDPGRPETMAAGPPR